MTRKKRNSFNKGVLDIIVGGTTLSVGAVVTGSIPNTPTGIANNVQSSLRLASSGLTIKGAMLPIRELKKLKKFGR